MRRIERRLGESGYARALKLMELVAQIGDQEGDRQAATFSASFDLRRVGIEHVAENLGISTRETWNTLRQFAAAGLIDPDKLSQKIVVVPGMLQALDEWAEKRARKQKAATAKESLGSNSGVPPIRSESEKKEIRTDHPDTASQNGNGSATHDDDFVPPPLEMTQKDDSPALQQWARGVVLSRARTSVSDTDAFLRKALPKFFRNLDGEVIQWLAQRGADILASGVVSDELLGNLAERLKLEASANYLPYTPNTMQLAIAGAVKRHQEARSILTGTGPRFARA